MKSESRISASDEIEEMIENLSSRHFARLINFCDIVNRYVDIVFRDRVDWLKTTALIVIVYIGKGSVSATELARNLLRSKQSMTRLIGTLEKDGSIIRERFKEDRRTINIRITSLGLSYLAERLKDVDIADQMLRSCLKKKEMEIFFTLTRKVRRNAIQEVSKKKGKKAKINEPINPSGQPSVRR